MACNHRNLTALTAHSLHSRRGVPLKRIQLIDLSHNLIAELTGDHFRYVTRLQRLDLSWNALRRIVADLFRWTAHLSYLDLSANLIADIRYSLGSLARLHTVHLHSNPLASLERAAFETYLTDNPTHFNRRDLDVSTDRFSCDCTAAWLADADIVAYVRIRDYEDAPGDVSAKCSVVPSLSSNQNTSRRYVGTCLMASWRTWNCEQDLALMFRSCRRPPAKSPRSFYIYVFGGSDTL